MTGAGARWDVAVLGGGAAGLFAASIAAARGRRTIVLEGNREPGRKILISGGGRCNFTNTGAAPERYLSANPHFARSALARYTPADFTSLLRRHHVGFHEKKLGQLFCDDRARRILDLLLAECTGAGAEVRCGIRVEDLEKPDAFRIHTSAGPLEADVVIVATGGLSLPKLGASDVGHRIARRFGLALIPPRAGLVPLTLPQESRDRLAPLSGVAFDARASAGGTTFDEAVLITHRGLSGPAILQVSSYWQPGQSLSLDLLPGLDARTLLEGSRRGSVTATSVLADHLPRRLAEALVDKPGADRPLAQWSRRDLDNLAARLKGWELSPSGTEGYATAEVTIGGVDTRELSSRTLEARTVPGLHFIGEVVDVTGWLGGYNFQWAWASAHAAASSL